MKNMLKPAFSLAPLLSLALLTACGGGGDDEAGAPTALSVVPSTITFTAPTGLGSGVCVAGGTAKIFVYGGAAPYRIDNTVPDNVATDVGTVDDPGGSFNIQITSSGCLSPGNIVVLDKLNNRVTLQVNNAPSTTTGS